MNRHERGFQISLFAIDIGYTYFRGKRLPADLPFVTAGEDLLHDFGHKRVKAVLKAIPREASREAALAAAKAADPGA